MYFKKENSAERVGFEPTLRYKRKHAFQACAFSHSATSPKVNLATSYFFSSSVGFSSDAGFSSDMDFSSDTDFSSFGASELSVN